MRVASETLLSLGPDLVGIFVPGASLIAAKLKMTVWSTLAAWLLVVIFCLVALKLSGRMPVVVERARAGIDVTGTLRGIAVVLFVFAALFASTWKHLVQSLCIGLTGSEWLIKGSVLLALAVTCFTFFGSWGLCTQQFVAPPFVHWAIEAGWDVRYHIGSTCWVLTSVYTDSWKFCVDGTGENVTPWPEGLSP